MKTNNSYKSKSFITVNIVIIILFSVFGLYAQNVNTGTLDKNEIESLVSKLQKKVLLTDSQKKSIQSVLSNYSDELIKLQSGKDESKYSSKQHLLNEFSEKINSLLDEKQKMKFEIIKKDWWNSVISEEND